MDRQWSSLTKLGFGVLACNSALAIYNSWGDAGSVALVLLLLCLRKFERPPAGQAGAPAARIVGMDGRYSGLAKIGFAVLACNSALAIHEARTDAGSLVVVFATYAALVALTWLFLRNFGNRAHGRGAGQRPDQGHGVDPNGAAHGDIRIEAGGA